MRKLWERTKHYKARVKQKHIVKSFITPKAKIGKARIGKGLFALKKIRKGELVVDFTNGPGKFLSTKQADALYEKGND